MSYRSNPKLIRLGLTTNWAYISIQDKNGDIFDYNIRNVFFVSIKQRIQRPRKTLVKRKMKIRGVKVPLRQSPAFIGTCQVIKSSGWVYVSINYYIEIWRLLRSQRYTLYKNLRQVEDGLQTLLGLQLKVAYTNFRNSKAFIDFYRFFHKPIEQVGTNLVSPSLEVFKFYRYRLFWIKQLSGYIRRKIRKWRQRFFLRGFWPSLATFLTPQLDCEILADIIAHEFIVLRQRHKVYLRYLKHIIRFFKKITRKRGNERRLFNTQSGTGVFKTRSFRFGGLKKSISILWLRVKITGRFTIQGKQGRRTQTKTIRWGKSARYKRAIAGRRHLSELRFYRNHGLRMAPNRFGAMSIQVSCHQRTVKFYPIESDIKEDIKVIGEFWTYSNPNVHTNRLSSNRRFEIKQRELWYFKNGFYASYTNKNLTSYQRYKNPYKYLRRTGPSIIGYNNLFKLNS